MWYNLMWLAVDGVDDHDHDAIFNVDDMMMPWYYDVDDVMLMQFTT